MAGKWAIGRSTKEQQLGEVHVKTGQYVGVPVDPEADYKADVGRAIGPFNDKTNADAALLKRGVGFADLHPDVIEI